MKTKQSKERLVIFITALLIFLITKPLSTGLIGNFESGVREVFDFIAATTFIVFIYSSFMFSGSVRKNKNAALFAVFVASLMIEMANSFIRQGIEPDQILPIITGVIFCMVLSSGNSPSTE